MSTQNLMGNRIKRSLFGTQDDEKHMLGGSSESYGEMPFVRGLCSPVGIGSRSPPDPQCMCAQDYFMNSCSVCASVYTCHEH